MALIVADRNPGVVRYGCTDPAPGQAAVSGTRLTSPHASPRRGCRRGRLGIRRDRVEREAYEHITVADIDINKAEAPSRPRSNNDRGGRIVAAHIDASSEESVAELARSMQADVILNACDPRFNPPIFSGAFAGRMQLRRHGDEPVAAAPDPPVLEDAASGSATASSPNTRCGRTAA